MAPASPPVLVFQTLQFGAQWAPIERIRYELLLQGEVATVTATREQRPHVFKGVVIGGGDPTKWTQTATATFKGKATEHDSEMWLEFPDAEDPSTYVCKDQELDVADVDIDVMAGDKKADCSVPITPFPSVATHKQHVVHCSLHASKHGVGIEFRLTEKPGGWFVFGNPGVELVIPIDSCIAESSGYRHVPK